MSDKYESIRAADPSLLGIKLGGQRLLLKTPSRALWEEFTSKVDDAKTRSAAVNRLVRDCVVYPEAEALDAFLEAKPARAMKIAGEITRLAGGDEEVEIEKP